MSLSLCYTSATAKKKSNLTTTAQLCQYWVSVGIHIFKRIGDIIARICTV